MLTERTKGFIAYCKTAGFKDKSIESLSIRLNEFKKFLQCRRLRKIPSITYDHLSCFVADFGSPSVHVKKARIWMLHQFYHYLALENVITENIAMGLPYPKIERTAPRFLTVAEYNRILAWCSKRTSSYIGARDLVIVLMLGKMWGRGKCGDRFIMHLN
jgi:integrase/recombinase XerC